MSGARRLAVIMFTDMVGYSAVAYKDERLAIELVAEQRQIVREFLPKYHGREHQTTGDGFFIEFGSAVEAVYCAMAIQLSLRERNHHTPLDRQIRLRIGIHLGDILMIGEDLYGNSVNLAARIEPLAPTGGICITRQVHDLVREKLPATAFQKLGQHHLKNIKSGAEIYRVIMPWERKKHRLQPVRNLIRFDSTNWNTTVFTTLFLVCFLILGTASLKGLAPLLSIFSSSARAPASDSARVDLSTDWQYQVASDETSQGPEEQGWQDLEPKNSWKYSDQIHGRYWMKKSFVIHQAPTEPAFVLGLIADSHRTFLNGHFVGGSDEYGDVSFYSFDPSYLNLKGNNEILVVARARPSLNPGLVILPETGAFVGEFSSVHDAVKKDLLRYRILEGTFFTLSALMFLACLGYAVFFRPRSTTYYYCAFILLLGALHLSFYSPWVQPSFSYEYVRLFKCLGLALAPAITFSALLHERKRRRWELYNNILACLFFVAICVSLLVLPDRPSQYADTYNLIYVVSCIYSAVWLAYAMLSRFRSHPRRRRAKRTYLLRYLTFDGAYIVAGLMGLSSMLSALKTQTTFELLSNDLRIFMYDIELAGPFLFAVFMIAVTTIDHIRKSRVAKLKERRDRLMLELVRVMRSGQDPHRMISEIQYHLCRYLRSSRSTLYVFDEKNNGEALKASFVVGLTSAKFEIKRRLNTNEGIIGYAFQNSRPLLIEDIRRDPRFFGPSARFPINGTGTYRSGSCMIFPLASGSRLVGVLTFADRIGGEGYSFSKHEFKVGLEVSPSLALLLDNRRMQEILAKFKGAA